MGHKQIGRYSARSLKRALMAGVGAGLIGSAATAQVTSPEPPLKMQTDYFGYAASVSTRATYTDNVNLQNNGLRESEYILSTALTGGAIVSTPRVTALVLGDLDLGYMFDREDFVVSQNIGVTSTFTAVDNWFYVDVSGQTARQLVGDNARYSGNITSARGQQANVHSYAASPYIYRRMADQSAVELRYRFSQVFVDDDDSIYNLFNGNFLNDSQSQEVFASYESGAKLDRFRFRIGAYGNKTEETGSGVLPEFEYKQGSVFGEAQLALSDRFGLSGAAGYDEVETDQAASLFFNDDELSGAFWRAGFTARPNRRSRVRFEYGERYGDDFIDADVFYELSKRLVFTAGASRSFQTRAQGINSQFRGVQTQTLDFADRLREGAELSPRSVIEAANRFSNVLSGRATQTIGVAVTDQAYAALSALYDRTEITLRGNYSDSDFGFRQVENYGLRLDLRHKLSRRLTGYAGVDYRHIDTAVSTAACEANPVFFGLDITDPMFDAVADCAFVSAQNGVTNTVIGRVGGSYQLYKNVSVFAEYSHAERFSPVDTLEYAENTGIVGITLDF